MFFSKGIFRNRLWGTLCLALFFTGFSFYVAGYKYGRYIDIAYVKNFLNPDLFVKDTLLFHHLEQPYLYYHRVVAFLASWTRLDSNLELLFVMLYGIATFFTILALIKITDYLFQNRKTTILFLFLFILNCRLLSLGEPSLHLMELAPEVVVRPFILFSLYFFLKRRYFISLSIAGFAFNLHIAWAGYLLMIYAIYFIYQVISTRKFDVLNLLKAWGICLVLSLPALIPLLSMTIPPEGMESWMLDLRIYLIYGHSSPTILLATDPIVWLLSLFGGLLIAIAAYKTSPEKAKNRTVMIIFLAVGILYLLGYAFVDVFPTHLFHSMSLPRATWFIALFGLIYVANFFRASLGNNYVSASVILLFLLSLIFGNGTLWVCSVLLIAISTGAEYISSERLKYLLKSWFPLTCLAGLILINVMLEFMSPDPGIIHKILNKLSMPISMFALLAIGIISIALIEIAKRDSALLLKQIVLISLVLISIILPLHSIGIQSSATQDWKDVQIWSNTTPEGSLFIIPLEYIDFYDYSNRPVVFNRACMGPMDMYPDKINEVLERLTYMDIDLREVEKRHNWSRQLLQDSWGKLSDFQFQALADKYNAQYIIRERELPLNFERVYENKGFVVYKIK